MINFWINKSILKKWYHMDRNSLWEKTAWAAGPSNHIPQVLSLKAMAGSILINESESIGTLRKNVWGERTPSTIFTGWLRATWVSKKPADELEAAQQVTISCYILLLHCRLCLCHPNKPTKALVTSTPGNMELSLKLRTAFCRRFLITFPCQTMKNPCVFVMFLIFQIKKRPSFRVAYGTSHFWMRTTW